MAKKKKPVTQNVTVSYIDESKGKLDIFIDGVKIGTVKPKTFTGIELNLN